MSKAILVVDMPQSCSKCKFAYQFNGIHKCHLMNVSNGRYTRISETTFAVERHYHCPLKEVPEKKVKILFFKYMRMVGMLALIQY